MDAIEKLKELYNSESKHSNYQILSKRLNSYLSNKQLVISSRHEEERLSYVCSKIDIKNKTIMDIGGNTGYFSFELIDRGAKKIHYYEGNEVHVEFVRHAAKLLDVVEKIEITAGYFPFESEIIERKYDVIFLLNVLHHVGDDYGGEEISIEIAKQNIIKQLNRLANKTSILVFQLGFNWKGNRNLGIFENGTKKAMIDFINKGITNYWSVEKIGIAESVNNLIYYTDINDNNIQRNDKLGEFLNRPIFILKSKI